MKPQMIQTKPAGRFIALVAALAALFVFSYCAKEDPTGLAGGSSENGNAIHGTVLAENGEVAANAEVTLVTVSHTPGLAKLAKAQTVLYRAYTDEKGEYSLGSVPSGTFNLLAKGNNTGAFVDSIQIGLESDLKLPDARMKKPGSLHGQVVLQPGHDLKTVFIMLMGTDIFAMPIDSTGAFDLLYIPEGSYQARIYSTWGGYSTKDTIFTVRSGQKDTLGAAIRLLYNQTPKVHGVTLTFDTLRQIVTLKWNKPYGDIKGYLVYRSAPDAKYWRLTDIPITDTFFVDDDPSKARQADMNYYYQIRALDQNDRESEPSNLASVFTQQAFVAADTIMDIGQDSIFFADRDNAGNLFFMNAKDSLLLCYTQTGSKRWQTNLKGEAGYREPLYYHPPIRSDGQQRVYAFRRDWVDSVVHVAVFYILDLNTGNILDTIVSPITSYLQLLNFEPIGNRLHVITGGYEQAPDTLWVLSCPDLNVIKKTPVAKYLHTYSAMGEQAYMSGLSLGDQGEILCFKWENSSMGYGLLQTLNEDGQITGQVSIAGEFSDSWYPTIRNGTIVRESNMWGFEAFMRGLESYDPDGTLGSRLVWNGYLSVHLYPISGNEKLVIQERGGVAIKFVRR